MSEGLERSPNQTAAAAALSEIRLDVMAKASIVSSCFVERRGGGPSPHFNSFLSIVGKVVISFFTYLIHIILGKGPFTFFSGSAL